MGDVILTGASGYLGLKILQNMLENTSYRLILPLRGESEQVVEHKRQQLLKTLGDEFANRIITVHSEAGNFSEKLDEFKLQVVLIVHNAAVTAFNVDENVANKVNRDGSQDIFELARKCPSLEKLLYISTVYTSGLASGEINESFHAQPNFANHYERSKWEAEELLRTHYRDLPWCIARVATVFSDDDSGHVIQQNAVHNTLKLFYYGLISLLPGNPQVPLYLVRGDFVNDCIRKIIVSGQVHQIYHVCHSKESSIKLGQFLDIAFDEFNKDETFRARRLLKPLFADAQSFSTLVDNVKVFGGSILNQGVSSIAPFGQQLFVSKNIRNENLRSILADYHPTNPEDWIRRTCSFLAKTRFARHKQ